MRLIRTDVTREEVIAFYVRYDLVKKGRALIQHLNTWPWDNPNALDQKLLENRLKPGVLSAYRTWSFVELGFRDILSCAIVNHIFPGHPQVLRQLITQNVIESWVPGGEPEWLESLSSGNNLPPEWALILRPAVVDERPAEWYIEDGSGRALAIVQHALLSGNTSQSACAYLGTVPDYRSSFIRARPELHIPPVVSSS